MRFNAILMFYILFSFSSVFFSIRNENNNSTSLYLHRFDCLANQKNALIWRFWLVPLITNHHAFGFNLLPVCQHRGSVGEYTDPCTTQPHSVEQPEIHTAMAFDTYFFSPHNICCVVFILHCVEIYQRQRKKRHNTSHRRQPITAQQKQ